MIIYIEKKAKTYKKTQEILTRFPNAHVIEILHYKNVFDKKTGGLQEKRAIILAKLESPAITKAPARYGHSEEAYFFKTSLNCVYDCDYCFLKGAFSTDHLVFFVNTLDIKEQIRKKIEELRSIRSTPIWFYSSDYSDIQGMDSINNFNRDFIAFFEEFENVHMEIRTKSGNTESLLKLGFTPKNTEIAFSLNPQELIDRYEHKTANLEMRIQAINQLLERGFRVGIRLLPLLPVKNYKNIYREFFEYISNKIEINQLSSSFAGGLLFTKGDYKQILKRYPHLDILHYLELSSDSFYRESREVRDWFYTQVKTFDRSCLLCLDS